MSTWEIVFFGLWGVLIGFIIILLIVGLTAHLLDNDNEDK